MVQFLNSIYQYLYYRCRVLYWWAKFLIIQLDIFLHFSQILLSLIKYILEFHFCQYLLNKCKHLFYIINLLEMTEINRNRKNSDLSKMELLEAVSS